MGIDAQLRDNVHKLPVPAPADRTSRAEEMDLRRVLASLWRSRGLILLTCLAGLAISALWLRQVVPQYSARAEVLWDVAESNVVDIDPVSTSGLAQEYLLLQSQIEIVRSSRLLGRVVDDLALRDDPVFNVHALPPEERPLPLRDMASALRLLARWGLDLGAPPLPPDPPPAKQREIAIAALRAMVEVRWIDNSYVLTIRATVPEAALAARLANTIAKFYILDQLEKKFDATRAATTWLSERVADLRQELEEAERAVEDFSAASLLVSPEALEAESRKIKDMRERIRELGVRSAEDAALAAELAALRAQDGFAEIADRLRRPDLVALAGDIADAPQGAARTEAVARFDRALEGTLAGLKQSRSRSTEQQAALSRTVTDLEATLEKQSAALVQLRQLEREAEASRLIYESFLSRLKETTVQEGIQQPDARMLSEAWVPDRPSAPNAPALLGIGLVIGLSGGLALVILRERLNATYRTAPDLEMRTGQAVLGTIPMAPLQRRQALLDYLTRKPGSGFAEAIRNLRTSILLANVDKPPQVIMISSGLPGEGKTTTAISLAHISRQLGKSVVLIECDLRRRNFRRYFGIEHENGLLSVLSGRLGYHEVVHVEEGSGLHVLPGEKTTVNAADIFASQRFADFIRELRTHYDFIIIDTPPVLAVPDARVIAQQADALVYAVHWNRTARETVDQGLRGFAQVNARVTGIVLCQVDVKDMARYGYRAYGYYREAEKYYHE